MEVRKKKMQYIWVRKSYTMVLYIEKWNQDGEEIEMGLRSKTTDLIEFLPETTRTIYGTHKENGIRVNSVWSSTICRGTDDPFCVRHSDCCDRCASLDFFFLLGCLLLYGRLLMTTNYSTLYQTLMIVWTVPYRYRGELFCICTHIPTLHPNYITNLLYLYTHTNISNPFKIATVTCVLIQKIHIHLLLPFTTLTRRKSNNFWPCLRYQINR